MVWNAKLEKTTLHEAVHENLDMLTYLWCYHPL